MDALSDENLVELYRNTGDGRPFEVLLGRHIGKVRAMVYPMVLNDMDADDITQEVFIRAANGISGFRRRARFTTWLYRITMNTAKSFLVESIVNGDEDTVPMLLRLAVVSRDLDGECWVPSWRTDVLMRGEEMVEIRPARKSDNNLSFWVYPLVDGKLAVEGKLSLEAPIRLASQINRVIRPGETVEVASMKNDAREYRVYQTVEML